MSKRDIGQEILDGIHEVKSFKASKKILRTHSLKEPSSPKVIRAKLKLSQSAFAGLLIMVFAFAFSGCQSPKNDGFAIYLLTQDISATKLSQSDIGQLILQREPILSSDDILSYDKTNHSLELTQAAYTRIQQIFPMPVKVDGIPFVVCVGKERIYLGAFWTPVSSLSYDGVVILQPFEAKPTTIQIVLGYPVSDVFTGNDPRADSRIMKAFEQEKKLK
jgi:hypothetical protein